MRLFSALIILALCSLTPGQISAQNPPTDSAHELSAAPEEVSQEGAQDLPEEADPAPLETAAEAPDNQEPSVSNESQGPAPADPQAENENENLPLPEASPLPAAPEPVAEPEPEPEPEEEPLHQADVTFEGNTYFTLKQVGGEPAQLNQQAADASENLRRALQSLPADKAAETLEFERTSRNLTITLAETPLITLTSEHLQGAELPSFEVYERELQAQMSKALSERATRVKWQNRAKNFFLMFLYIATGIVIWGQLTRLFEKTEEALLERKERFQPIKVFSETLIQGQTVGAFLTLALVVGRVVALALVLIITALAVLNQFDSSRSVLYEFFQHFAGLAVDGLHSLVEAIPSILLGLILILGLYFSLRVAGLYLRSLSLGRVKFKTLPPHRLPVARFWTPLILFIAFAPFIVSALLTTRFSSMEIGIVSFGILCLLGFFPFFTNAAIGSFVLWNGSVREGQWIEVGEFHGEITSLSLFEINLVPADGGVVRIPMLYLVNRPVQIRAETPKLEILFTVRKIGSLRETLETVEGLFPEKWKIGLDCLSVSKNQVKVLLRAGKFESDIKDATLHILSDADDKNLIDLTSEFVEEVLH